MTIPADEDMMQFKSQLEQEGISEVERKVNQGIWGTHDAWKVKEAKRFLENKKTERMEGLLQEANRLYSEANKLHDKTNCYSRYSIVIAVSALLISIATFFLK